MLKKPHSGMVVVEICCADCNAPDPQWASVNRGVLLCNDCASIHQTLGRHISQIKHTQKSHWHPSQLQMVQQLAQIGANSIWEHYLLDPSQKGSRKKPVPHDLLRPNKEEFIRAKYELLHFVCRNPRERGDDDLGKQLHSSVRTANLDTSLRLLSIGAQANYYHAEKGNTPLHVAAKSGQSLQIELLVSYGADPAYPDVNRMTPEDIARSEGHQELADRLVELQYELPDRLTYFAGKVRPDHRTRNHYIVPRLTSNGVSKDGKIKLQALSNQIFEELAVDVYDEIDRRETEMIWKSLMSSPMMMSNRKNFDYQANPFLTLNPDYSTTRNQGRQKLARFSEHEFTILIHDILCDIIRRQCGKEVDGIIDGDEDDPIYDIPPDGQPEALLRQKEATHHPYPNNNNTGEVEEENDPTTTIPLSHLRTLEQQISDKDLHIRKLENDNRNLTEKAAKFLREINDLKRQVQHMQSPHASKPTRPSSAVIPKPDSHGPVEGNWRRTLMPQTPSSSMPVDDDGNRPDSPLLDPFANKENEGETIPPYSDVEEKAKVVTKTISVLLMSAQQHKISLYKQHTENIYTSVMDVINLFPKKSMISDDLMEVIKKFYTASCKLKKRSEDLSSKLLTEGLIKKAYEVAKAEKDLVTIMKEINNLPTTTATSKKQPPSSPTSSLSQQQQQSQAASTTAVTTTTTPPATTTTPNTSANSTSA